MAALENITKDEFRILVKAMKATYTQPGFIPDEDAAKVWYRMLRDLSYEVLTNAVQVHMMTNPFPPTIADLRTAAAQFIPGGPEISELEAWNMVRRAIGNSVYHADEEYEKLPVLVRKAVGNPANLREWAMMDTDTVNSVEQSHFIRSYRTAVAREKELQRLSPIMRRLIDKVTAGLGLEKAEEESDGRSIEQYD